MAAMVAEMDRSAQRMRVPGSPRPYYVGYSLRCVELVELSAAWGALSRRRHGRRNRIFAEVRVGSRRFDNVMDGGLGEEEDEREGRGEGGPPHGAAATPLARVRGSRRITRGWPRSICHVGALEFEVQTRPWSSKSISRV